MEEQYVDFETACKLKECGFTANISTRFIQETMIDWCFSDSGPRRSDYNLWPDNVICPTQALAGRWLREKHNLHIHVNYYNKGNDWYYVILDTEGEREIRTPDRDSSFFSSYEDAFEVALLRCLDIVKKRIEEGK